MTEKKMVESFKETSEFMKKIQENCAEKIVKSRESLDQKINDISKKLDKITENDWSSQLDKLSQMLTESHNVLKQDREALKIDTEKQLHDVCSMVEDLSKFFGETNKSVLSRIQKVEDQQTDLQKIKDKENSSISANSSTPNDLSASQSQKLDFIEKRVESLEKELKSRSSDQNSSSRQNSQIL